jgi:hypothetical protein
LKKSGRRTALLKSDDSDFCDRTHKNVRCSELTNWI